MNQDRLIKYRNFCNNIEYCPIFYKDWWLDSVCGKDKWDFIQIEIDNKISAVLPYYSVKKLGFFNLIVQPHLTKYSGILVNWPKFEKQSTKYKFERDIHINVICNLQKLKYSFFKQNFFYDFNNWLEFYRNDFVQTVYYSYVLELGFSNLQDIYKKFDSNIRTDIKKAERNLVVFESEDIELFYSVNLKTFKRKNKRIPYSNSIIKALYEELVKNKCVKLLFAKDKDGEIHAAILLVWDSRSVYYLMGGLDPKYKGSGASSLLIWNGIQYSYRMNLNFDFEGGMDKNIGDFFRGFGAKLYPYYNISHIKNSLIKFYISIKSL